MKLEQLVTGNGGVAIAWSIDKICCLSEKGFFNPAFWKSSVICVCRRSVEGSISLLSGLGG